MQIQRLHRLTKRSRRRGLAPLEFVLSVPILMCVMALIVNFGNIACWKVRAAEAARQVVWRNRWDRTGNTDPAPAGWPTTNPTANMSVGAGQALFQDPFQQHTVVRGPVIQAQGAQNGIMVDSTRLDFTDGVSVGQASLTVSYPLLPKLPKVTFNLKLPTLVEGRWQYSAMGIPRNTWYRIPFIYPQLKHANFFNNVPQQRQAFIQAAQAIMSAPFKSALNPLDRDDEFYDWYAPQQPPYPGYTPPDFHPRIEGCYYPGVQSSTGDDPDCTPCMLDPNQVRMILVEGIPGMGNGALIPRIKGFRGQGKGGVPENMARAFIQMYQAQIQAVKDGQANLDINALQQKIDALNTFIGTLN